MSRLPMDDETRQQFRNLLFMTTNVETLDFVLKQGINVDTRSINVGRTALHKAAYSGNYEVCEFLVESGANINITDYTGITPLIDSSMNEHLCIVNFLLENDANADTADYSGVNSLHIACVLLNEEIVFSLLNYGANAKIATNENKTPLHEAFYSMRIRRFPSHFAFSFCNIISLLIVSGADIEAKDETNKNCLELAKEYGMEKFLFLALNEEALDDARLKLSTKPLKEIVIPSLACINFLYKKKESDLAEILFLKESICKKVFSFLVPVKL